MSKFGGIQDKIKIINVVRNILDIQTTNLIELNIKFEDHPAKNEFILLASRLQKISFLYEPLSVDISDTILLRNLLYNPAVYPIILQKKDNAEHIYTRTPIRKHILNKKLKIYCIPQEESIYVIGIAINVDKQGSIEDSKKVYIINEYLDLFETHNNFKYIYFEGNENILHRLLKQLIYSVNFYNAHNYLSDLHDYRNKKILEHKKKEIQTIEIKSWYTSAEIEYIQFLLKDKRKWIYNLDPLQTLGNNIDQLLYIITEGYESEKVKEFFILQEMTKNKINELQKIENETLKFINMAKQYIIIIGKKLGSNIQQKIMIEMSRNRYLRLPGGSMAIPSIDVNIVNPNEVLKYLTKEQQSIIKLEYNKLEQFRKSYVLNKCEHLLAIKKLLNSKNIENTKLNLGIVANYFLPELSNGYHVCSVCDFHIMCSHAYDKYKYQINNVPISTINTNLLEYAIKVRVNKEHEYYCKYCGEQLIKELYIEDEYKFKPKFVLSEEESEIRDYTWSVIMTIIQTASLSNEKATAIYISNIILPLIKEKITKFDDSAKLTCIMYTYSFILILIKNQKITVLNIDSTLPLSKIAEKLLNFIYSKYNKIVYTSSIDIIKTEFMNAYKIINSIGEPISIEDNQESNLANFIINIDPIYQYAKKICILTHILKDTSNIKKEFETILGTSLPNIIKSAKENVKNSTFVDILNKRFGHALQVENLDFFYKHPKLNIYENLISIDNEDTVLKRFLEGDNNYYYFANYVLFCKYIKNVKNEIEYEDYRKLFQSFNKQENKMFIKTHIYSRKPFFNIIFLKNSHFIKRDIKITELYDENGMKHIWNVFHYSDKSYTGSKIPGSKPSALTDISCSVCGIKKSNIDKLNITKTTNVVKVMSDINSFYMFYKLRCPAGEIHNWVNNICSKCSLTDVMIDQINSNKINSSILDYYNKYLTVFSSEKKTDELLELQEKTTSIAKYITKDWIYDYTPIVKVSQLTKISTIIIESIGLTEKRMYSEVENGTNIPEIELFHVYSAYSELIYLLSKYCEKIKNHDYLLTFNSLIYTKSYSDVHKFILQSICEIVLKTNDITEFINIINHQKMLAMPSSYFVFDDSDDVVYLGDDIGDSGEDLIVDQRVENNYESSLNIDYPFTEDNPNNELHIDIPNEYIYT